jgi:hypothetical protein
MQDGSLDPEIRNFDPKDKLGLISIVCALLSVAYTFARPYETQDEVMALTVVFSVISMINAASNRARVSMAIVIVQFIVCKILTMAAG